MRTNPRRLRHSLDLLVRINLLRAAPRKARPRAKMLRHEDMVLPHLRQLELELQEHDHDARRRVDPRQIDATRRRRSG